MSRLWHFRYGWHSRIPLCCIVEWLLRDRFSSSRNFSERVDRLGGPRVESAEYVPCTACCLAIRFGFQRAADIRHCAPVHRECDEWTHGKKYAHIDGRWMALLVPVPSSERGKK